MVWNYNIVHNEMYLVIALTMYVSLSTDDHRGEAEGDRHH